MLGGRGARGMPSSAHSDASLEAAETWGRVGGEGGMEENMMGKFVGNEEEMRGK